MVEQVLRSSDEADVELVQPVLCLLPWAALLLLLLSSELRQANALEPMTDLVLGIGFVRELAMRTLAAHRSQVAGSSSPSRNLDECRHPFSNDAVDVLL